MSEPPSPPRRNRLLVILTSLCAEGTPVLALDMCRWWMSKGISPIIATLSDHPSDLEPEFQAAGIQVENLRLPRTGSARFPLMALALYRLCRSIQPRAVLSMPLGWHAFMFMGARAAGVRFTAAHVGNYPPVHTVEGLAKFRLLVQMGRPVTDSLICCSSYIQAGVTDHFGIPVQETQVIYNGVDTNVVSQRAAVSRANRHAVSVPVVGMVARLEVHKDQPTLIRAAAILRDAGRPVEVWLVGEGSRREEYERLIGDLGLGHFVKLLGMRRDVPELLGQMDAFVFSAKPDEGLGVALVEAMAASVPVIATDVGACREVLQDGALGRLVPQGDAATMAEAIDFVTHHGPERADIQQRARQRATNIFSIDEMARRYAQCLKMM